MSEDVAVGDVLRYAGNARGGFTAKVVERLLDGWLMEVVDTDNPDDFPIGGRFSEDFRGGAPTRIVS